MDSKLKSRVISALRKLSYSHKPRNVVKNAAKIDICLYKCSGCGILVYDGKSDERYEEYCSKYGLVLYDRINMDHINPVVNPDIGWENWDIYITRMFCDEAGWQAICSVCHDKKTKEEKQRRKTAKTRKI